jgi:hypothetical protein
MNDRNVKQGLFEGRYKQKGRVKGESGGEYGQNILCTYMKTV